MRKESLGKDDIVPNLDHIDRISAIDTEFKASHYNEFLGCLDGEWVIYNNLSGGLIEVNQHIYDSLLDDRVRDITSDNQIKALKYNNRTILFMYVYDRRYVDCSQNADCTSIIQITTN